jgi:acetyltransferase-like isoleucine patch superfamily enzyme/acyl carrier protein
VLARPTLLRLLRYELAGLFGPLPGALGLALRSQMFPGLLATCGKGAVFGRNITLRHPDNIRMGQRVLLDDYCLVDARGAGQQGVCLGDRVMVHRGACIQAKVGPICVGEDTSIGAFSQLISQGPIEIGANVSIATGVIIAGGTYQVESDEDGPEVKKRFTYGAIRIEPNVRIGMRAIILDGVTIGRNAIVAPGSIVMNDVPPGTVVTGSPARPLRSRQRRQAPAGSPVAGSDAGSGSARIEAARVPPSVDGERLEAVRAVIRNYLAETYFVEFGPGGVGDDDSLFDEGIIDSAGVVALVTLLEQEFDVGFDENDLQPERLSTINGLAGLTVECLQRGTAGPAGSRA